MTEQHDIEDRHDSLIVEGDDTDHVLPPQELDLFTPEPMTPPGTRWPMVLALIVTVALVAVVIVYAATR